MIDYPRPARDARGAAEMVDSLIGKATVLRPITTSDVEPLARLLQDAGVARWWGTYDSRRVSSDFLEDESARGFAIEADAQIVGVIDFYEETEPDYRHASLDIAIGDGFQGRGLGSDAMQTLMAYLVRRGHHRMTVDPAAANQTAIRFYASLGFRPVGVMRCYERGSDGSWHDGLLMEYLADSDPGDGCV
jgi:aminoglycoside 6'-N-acetyltransferase